MAELDDILDKVRRDKYATLASQNTGVEGILAKVQADKASRKPPPEMIGPIAPPGLAGLLTQVPSPMGPVRATDLPPEEEAAYLQSKLSTLGARKPGVVYEADQSGFMGAAPDRVAAGLMGSALPTRRLQMGQEGKLEALGNMAGNLSAIGGIQAPMRGMFGGLQAEKAAQAEKVLAEAKAAEQARLAAFHPELAGQAVGGGAPVEAGQAAFLAQQQTAAATAEESRRALFHPLPPDPEQGAFLTQQQTRVTAEREAERAALRPELAGTAVPFETDTAREQRSLRQSIEQSFRPSPPPQQPTVLPLRAQDFAERPGTSATRQMVQDTFHRSAQRERAESLSDFIIRRGGLPLAQEGYAGEQKAMLQDLQRPGLFNKSSRLTMVDMAREAQSAGYPVNADDVNQFINTLAKDVRAGKNVAGRVFASENPGLFDAEQRMSEELHGYNENIRQHLQEHLGKYGSLEEAHLDALDKDLPKVREAIDLAGKHPHLSPIPTLSGAPLRQVGAAIIDKLLEDKGSATVFSGLGEQVVKGSRRAFQFYKDIGGFSPVRELPPEMAAPLVEADSHGRVLGHVWADDVDMVGADLSFRDRRYLIQHGGDIFRGTEPVPSHMPGVQRYVDRARQVTDTVEKTATEYGVPHGRIENYFPQSPTKEAKEALLTRQGPLYDAIRNVAGPIGIEPDELSSLFLDDIATRRFGHLEKSRFLNLPSHVEVEGKMVPILKNNPFEVWPAYYRAAGRRLGAAKVFGPNSAETVNQMIEKVRTGSPDGIRKAGIIKDAFANLQGIPFDDPVAKTLNHPLTQGTAEILKSLMITTATIPHVAMGLVPSMALTGVRRTLSTAGKVLANSFSRGRWNPGGIAEDVEMARRVGAWTREGTLKDVVYGFEKSEMAGPLRRSVETLSGLPSKLTGLDWVVRQTAKIGAAAGRETMHDALQKALAGDGNMLADMADYFHFTKDDIGRWLSDKAFEPKDEARVMQMMASRTVRRDEFAVDVPRFFKHPIAREFLAFTGFLRVYGNLTLDSVRMAAKGNIRPLATLLGGLSIGSYGEIQLKKYLKGKNAEAPNADRAADAFMRSGMLGIWGKFGEDVKYQMQQPNSQTGPIEGIAKGLTPVWLRELDQLASFFFEGKEEGLRRAVPLYDMIAVQALGESALGQKSIRRSIRSSRSRRRGR